MRIEEDMKLDFKDVLFRPKRSTLRSRSEVDLNRTFTFRNSRKTWTGVPIMAANMDTVGRFEVFNVLKQHKMFTCIQKHYTKEEWAEFNKNCPAEDYNYLAITSGTSDKEYERLQRICKENPAIKFICIDVANGYSQHFVEYVRKVRATFPEMTIIAGNVVTGEMTEELILSGADIVKVGIGPGSVCTTRIQTGVGYPQLSAIIECADAAHGLGGLIIGDGGCTCPGDVSKAFGAGADFVMLGGMFAGHDESGGDLVIDEATGKKYRRFYGMSSDTAMEKYAGGVADYRASEGRTVLVEYKGALENTVKEILGGVRSTCTYVGAVTLKELSKRTTFVRVTQQFNSSLASQPQNVRNINPSHKPE
ncbi:MAG: GMP reductase [Alphaproteobacteria bacterium]|nr:GMP reductase [Alphaproteobacteria bacterium]